MNRVCFCRLALQSGMDADPRGRASLSRELELQECKKANYADLKHEKRDVSDLETFFKPDNTDSSILRCSPKQNVTTIIAGIEMRVCTHCFFMAGSRSLSLFSAACPG